MTADVSIIGLERVGLPRGLCFADRELSAIAVDLALDRLESLGAARMPPAAALGWPAEPY